MKRKELTTEEFAAKAARCETAEPDALDLTMLREEEKLNDGTTVDYDEFVKALENYSGKVSLRMPRSLHKELSESARREGVSLNQYVLYKLSR